MSAANYLGALPWMAQWWIDHLDVEPQVFIRCGYRDSAGGQWCQNLIGEVKIGDDRMMAMSRADHPEVEVDWTPLAAPTLEELEAEIAERAAEALKYVGDGPGDGTVVYKRKSYPHWVAPLDMMHSYTCKAHGDVEINPADLVSFIRDTEGRSRTERTYWAHRAVD